MKQNDFLLAETVVELRCTLLYFVRGGDFHKANYYKLQLTIWLMQKTPDKYGGAVTNAVPFLCERIILSER